MEIQGGYIVMSLKTGKPITVQNNVTHELALIKNVIDRVEQLADQEGTT